MKALLAGKHVLLEKPAADTAEETRKMFDLAASRGLILLEAFHYRYVSTSWSSCYILTLKMASNLGFTLLSNGLGLFWKVANWAP